MTIMLKVYDGFYYRPDLPDFPQAEPIRILSFNHNASRQAIADDLHSQVFYNGDYPELLDTVSEALELQCTGIPVKGTDGNWVIEIVRD